MYDHGSVLVVDPLDETRLVLRTMLERQGVRFYEARRPDEGLRLARTYRPDVIVLDIDAQDDLQSGSGKGGDVAATWNRETQSPVSSLVLLGSVRRTDKGTDNGQVAGFLQKPYHYGPLIRKIEEVLASRKTG